MKLSVCAPITILLSKDFTAENFTHMFGILIFFVGPLLIMILTPIPSMPQDKASNFIVDSSTVWKKMNYDISFY